MNDKTKNYSGAAYKLGLAVKHQCSDSSEVSRVKNDVIDGYSSWADMIYEKAFLNWGLWDEKIYKEYLEQGFDFSKICHVQDVYSQILLYYLIRPLVKIHFFHKKLLDIGCGNGIGLKVSSELLKTEYALGVDLVNKLVTNAKSNFYKENKINYIQSDAEHLALANERFDIVTNLESSHLYPRIEDFFSEVERVLSPGGFFCYADIHIEDKQQVKKLEAFIKTRKNLRIVQKHNITKMVQAAIYQRIIANEDEFYHNAKIILGNDSELLASELPSLAGAMGLAFLPWWKIRFKTPVLRAMGKSARNDKYWGKKYFFCYLVQKAFS
jgi:ubiquinone/menaquinone biosynthesis C-methylase UbiE